MFNSKKSGAEFTANSYAWLSFLSVRLFGGMADKLEPSLSQLKKALLEADMKILFRAYVSIVFFIALLSFLAAILFVIIFSIFFPLGALATLPLLIFVSIIISGYFYPFIRASSRKKDMDVNLPFAVNHMAAIAGSGVPSNTMFKLLTGFTEYGEVSKEAKKIVRNVDVFGEDVTTAIREVAGKTPSKAFQELLEGMLSTIETGGNLQAFLKQQAEKALFDYRLKREKYLEVLSTYADFYTAVMIAAPLFLVAILAIMNMIGGELFGMAIQDVMKIGILMIIPFVNIGFLLFIHLTQPEL